MGKREERSSKTLSTKYLKAWGQMPSRSFVNWLNTWSTTRRVFGLDTARVPFGEWE
ncbi:hypothetical protein JYQ62_03465 [Nostoc sp. UHCC 0702]|nr:hypothetical protein JYQ62_03465 [Nostoc sp. UHCC 0702]